MNSKYRCPQCDSEHIIKRTTQTHVFDTPTQAWQYRRSELEYGCASCDHATNDIRDWLRVNKPKPLFTT